MPSGTLPSSLCAGTHCAGACENGAGERQRSMPRVWVRRKSLGSTRHNQLPTLAHDTLPRHGVRHIAQPAHTVLGKIQNPVEQSCAHWWSHGGAHGGALHASGTASTCARPSLWKNQLLNGTELCEPFAQGSTIHNFRDTPVRSFTLDFLAFENGWRAQPSGIF